MDYSKIRSELQATSQQEAVTVNHRALITRTLTKYPVDYALFRELIQNSADAKAKDCVISFKSTVSGGFSKSHITDIGSITVDRLTVKNNGQYFKEDDWNRLREIAKGNPDENKIGAFGVGFYSVFELTDEPLVHSGTSVMSFYYDGDQLCYRRQTVPDSKSWTIIDLPYRTPQTLPTLSSFTAFLTLSFILLPIESITLQVDDITLLSLKKTISPQVSLDLPKGLSYVSPDRTLTLKSWTSESFSIEINYMNVTQLSEKITNNSFLSFGYKAFSSFIPGSKDPSEMTLVSAHLRKVTGRLAVNVSSQFARKMKETVLKAPPKEAVISMLTDNRDEKQLSKLTPPLSDYVFPKNFNDAKIFIGFPTKQSTSFKSHIAINQLIPTMERTAVDMANAYVKDWNKQILVMAGILSRAVYEYEFAQLKLKYPKVTPETMQPFLDDASYIMNRFEFSTSAPDVSVGNYIAHGFWRSSSKLSLPTQLGQILTSDEVRLADDDNAAQLIENIAIVPKSVAKTSSTFLKRAVELGLLKYTDANDIERELKAQTLTPARFQKLIGWCVSHALNSEIGHYEIQLIVAAGIVADSDGTTGSIYALKSISSYQDVLRVPNGYPLPPACLPAKLLESVNTREVEQVFGWLPLTLVNWLAFATANRDSIELDKNMYLSPEFSEKVLMRLSSNFEVMSTYDKTRVVELLGSADSIPTNLGMKKPSESYLHAIDLFPDLPIKSPTLLASREFLLAVGMRESVDVAFVLKLLTDPDPQVKWSTFDVIKYLTANQSKFKQSDWATLKTSSFFGATDGKLYPASSLYPPNTELEALGMRCLKWQYWNESTPEAKLIFKLGLKHHPPQEEILELANEKNHKSDTAFAYFLKNFEVNKYSINEAFRTSSACVKCTLSDGTAVKRPPSKCFTDRTVALFGFPVVDASLQNNTWMLGVRKWPEADELASVLMAHPPKDLATANKMFGFMSGLLGKISGPMRKRLRETQYIPVPVVRKRFDEKGKVVEVATVDLEYPNMVYFARNKDATSSGSEIYAQFFHFVDFAQEARGFLTFVGVREEPSITEISRTLVADPARMFELAESMHRYIQLLQRIANHWDDAISRDYALVSRMRKAKFLIGVVYEKKVAETKDAQTKAAEDDGDEFRLRYKQASVDQIVIPDNVLYANMFRNDLLLAPQGVNLEKLYRELGCRTLNQVIENKTSLGRIVPGYDGRQLKVHIAERAGLFLDSNRDALNRTRGGLKAAKRMLAELNIVALTHITVEYKVRYANLCVSGRGGVSPAPVRQTMTAYIGPGEGAMPGVVTLYVQPSGMDWFDVSQALVNKLLGQAVGPDSAIVLESLLASDLRALQRKGFNVNAIIRRREEEVQAEQEAAEALRQELEEKREAQEMKRREEEARQKEEEARRREEEAKRQKSMILDDETSKKSEGEAGPPPPYSSGGAIGGGQGWDKVKQALESAEQDQKQLTQQHSKGLLSKMWKSFAPSATAAAAQAAAAAQSAAQSAQAPSKPQAQLPPPQTPSPASSQRGMPGFGGGGIGGLGGERGPSTSSSPHSTTPSQAAAELSSVVSRSHAYSSSTLASSINTGDAARTSAAEQAAEQACNAHVLASLVQVAVLRGPAAGGGAELRFFAPHGDPRVFDAAQGMAAAAARDPHHGWGLELARFARVLRAVATIYDAQTGGRRLWQAMHAYWDPSSAVIAFNAGGSLFFNLAYFVGGSGMVAAREPGSADWRPLAQLDYWFTVAAHELAHNMVGGHGAAHSHYAESFVQTYLERYRQVAAEFADGGLKQLHL